MKESCLQVEMQLQNTLQKGTTTELKSATDVAKGLKVGKSYTSTAPVVGEELRATDGKVYVYKRS